MQFEREELVETLPEIWRRSLKTHAGFPRDAIRQASPPSRRSDPSLLQERLPNRPSFPEIAIAFLSKRSSRRTARRPQAYC
jgi:hypothetical protein